MLYVTVFVSTKNIRTVYLEIEWKNGKFHRLDKVNLPSSTFDTETENNHFI